MAKEPSESNTLAVAEPVLGAASAAALVAGSGSQTPDPIDEEARAIFIRTAAGLPEDEIMPSALLPDQQPDQQE